MENVFAPAHPVGGGAARKPPTNRRRQSTRVDRLMRTVYHRAATAAIDPALNVAPAVCYDKALP